MLQMFITYQQLSGYLRLGDVFVLLARTDNIIEQRDKDKGHDLSTFEMFLNLISECGRWIV